MKTDEWKRRESFEPLEPLIGKNEKQRIQSRSVLLRLFPRPRRKDTEKQKGETERAEGRDLIPIV